MKSLPSFLIAVLAFFASSSLLPAQTLFFSDTAPTTDWGGASNWNTTSTADAGNTAWVDDRVAEFGTKTKITNTGVRTLDGVNYTASGRKVISSSGGGEIGLNIGTIDITQGDGTLVFTGLFGGDLVKTGGGLLELGSSGSNAYVGTATVLDGTFSFLGGRTGTSTNVVVDGGILRFGSNSTHTMNQLTLTSGNVVLTQNIDSMSNTSVTVSDLSGTSTGIIEVNASFNAGAVNNVSSLNINQATNTSYAGDFDGTAANPNSPGTFHRLALTKSGVGDLTLTGAVNEMTITTQIDGGRLVVDTNTTSFGDVNASTALSVNSGGTLAGSGTVSTLAGDHVVVANGGMLEAGLTGSADTLTFALGDATTLLDVSAATASDGWFRFDLGDDSIAGTTYDTFDLTTGQLAIGSGLLDFADFDFNTLGGFGTGTYTLVSTVNGINGTLAAAGLSGTIDGLNGTLSISGNDLQLEVIPEPSTAALLALTGFGLVLLRRRRIA